MIKEINGYKVNTAFTEAAFILMILIYSLYAYNINYEIDYFNCIAGADIREECQNPFYKDTWKNYPSLPPGEYGTKLNNYVLYSPALIFLIALIINHFLYNRKQKGVCNF